MKKVVLLTIFFVFALVNWQLFFPSHIYAQQTCAGTRVINDWFCTQTGDNCIQWSDRCSNNTGQSCFGPENCNGSPCISVCTLTINTGSTCQPKGTVVACTAAPDCSAVVTGYTCQTDGTSCKLGGTGPSTYQCWVDSGPAPSGGGGSSSCVSTWCATTSECAAVGGTTGSYPNGTCTAGTVACCPPSQGGGWTPNCGWDTNATGYPTCNFGEGNSCGQQFCNPPYGTCRNCAPGLEYDAQGNCNCPRCRAQCTPACGQPSNCGGVCPSTDAGVPGAVTGLNPANNSTIAYNTTTNTVTLSWTAVSKADLYDLEVIPVTGDTLSCATDGAFCTYASNRQGTTNGSFAIIPSSQLFTPTNNGNIGGGLKGEYFNNKTLTGTPALIRTDATVNMNWQTGPYASGTGRPNDNWSARWTGKVLAPVTGQYTFRLGSDDGSRLYVNNVLLTPTTSWSNHGYTTYTGTANLTAGQKYDIRVEYYENINGAQVTLEWQTPVVPNSGLSTNSYTFTPTYGEYLYRVRATNNSCINTGEEGAWTNFTRFFITAPITGTVYNDPNNQATLVGNNCASPGATGAAQLRPGLGSTVTASDSRSASNSASILSNGTFTVNGNLFGGPSTVTLNPTNTNYTCTCPTGCVYSGLGAPITGLNYFISDSREPWWQTANGLVYAAQSNGTAVSTKVPPTCNGNCTPALAARDQYGTQNSSGFVITGGGGIVTSADQAQPLQYLNQDTRTDRVVNSQTNGPREDYAYFSQLYSIATNDTTDFTGAKPAGGPANGRAYYSNGNATINNPWTVASGESIVVFVNGDLTINAPITVDQNGFLAFIVKKNITFANTLGWSNLSETRAIVAGLYIADGQIIVASNPGNDLKFVGEGSFIGWGGVDMNREFTPKSNNNTVPAETFRFRPDFMVNVPERMTRPIYLWQETN
jgi:hypothetical protein